MVERPNVLIIADRADVFDYMHGIIHSRKYRVAVAGDGAKAIDLIQKIHFDMILLVDVPKINGSDAYHEIKNHSPETTVVKINIFDKRVIASEAIYNEIDDLKIGELIN